uniref:Extracellular domain of a sensor histidine kinase NagS n=1 Tax=Paenibacillus sp. FPU-7 TaxID=762821 RepID=A0AAN0NPC6_9BACL|nr:Chain A, Extracellular domain of a sensor histidine kinase NagS [Paenibacillus sp. FPU-7]8W7P_B Chain B, Extracellular domain of a sensor histidine kinase NagS [Paenibacillus sp. FPU-7]
MSQHMIEQNYAEQSEFTLKAIGRNINYVLKEANHFSESSMLREDIQQTLSINHEVDQVVLAEYNRLLQRTFLFYTPSYSVHLYNFTGQLYNQGKIGYERFTYESLYKSPQVSEVIKLNGKPLWLGPYEFTESSANPNLFTSIRMINNTYTMNNMGILLQQFQFNNELNEIFNYFGTTHSKAVRFMLVNQEGLIMMDNKGKLSGRKLSDYAGSPVVLGAEYQSRKMTFDQVESVVSVHHLALDDFGKMNWNVVSVTPWEYLSGRSEQLEHHHHHH